MAMHDCSVGDVIDRRYLLRREISRGDTAVLFEAQQLFTGRSIGCKLLHGDHCEDEVARNRLFRQARALTLVRHPNIVTVLDAGISSEGQPYLAMELLEGRSLEGILVGMRRLPVEDAVHIARQLCDALAHAHARGVVHRDVKPSNVFLARDDVGKEVVKLIDFGIATLPDAEREHLAPSSRHLTRSGQFLGTPAYTPVEDFGPGERIDLRRDLYALGVMLYECLTGVVPFSGTFAEILQQASSKGPTPLLELRPDAGANLGRLIETAIARFPEQRFANAETFGRWLVEATGFREGFSNVLRFAPPVRLPPPKSVRLDGPPPLPVAPVPAAIPPSRPLTPHAAAIARRQYARAPYVTPVRILDAKGAAFDGRTENISEGGILAVVNQPWTEEGIVSVRFSMPISGLVVTGKAATRWLHSARGVHAVGLAFAELSAEARTEVARYVALMGVET